jgi:hypothetical protein
VIGRRRTLAGAVALAPAVLVMGCFTSDDGGDVRFGQRIAEELVNACPPAAPGDEQARALCAGKLTHSSVLAGHMGAPFGYGAESVGGIGASDHKVSTRLDPLVFRRVYLSLLMFSPGMTIEPTFGGVTLIHVPMQLRNGLDLGSYPEPFWHAPDEWAAYQQSTELLLVLRDGSWRGALRGANQDTSRALVDRTWSGQWTWQEAGQTMPYVSQLGYLLSSDNPSAARLDAAYQALAGGLQQQGCLLCHAPDNLGGANPLDILTYPAQALGSRAAIVDDLQQNSMPPTNDLGLPTGIPDENARQALLSAAQEFKDAGDAALAFEGD